MATHRVIPSRLRLRRKTGHRRPPGLSPGTIVLHDEAHDLQLRAVRYGGDEPQDVELADLDALEALWRERGEAAADEVLWIRVSGHGDADRLLRLGEILALDPLILEDVAHVDQRPKVEASGADWMAFLRVCEEEPTETPIASWQVALLLRRTPGRGVVVTFEERPSEAFAPVLRRIRSGARLRARGADYLAYALFDAVVDRYHLVLETYRDRLDEMEETILDESRQLDLQALHRVRRDLLRIGRIATPLRDLIGKALAETELHAAAGDAVETGFGTSVRPYLADCHDHAVRCAAQVETLREVASSLLDLHLSMIGHRTNEVMKVLTIIGSIFIPLSFLAGLYGMNFDTASRWNMPELGWEFGYPALLGLMLVVAVGLLLFFRRRGWF